MISLSTSHIQSNSFKFGHFCFIFFSKISKRSPIGSVPVGLGGPGDALKQKQGGAKAGAAGKIRKPAAGGDNASVRSSRSGGSSTRNRGRK